MYTSHYRKELSCIHEFQTLSYLLADNKSYISLRGYEKGRGRMQVCHKDAHSFFLYREGRGMRCDAPPAQESTDPS